MSRAAAPPCTPTATSSRCSTPLCATARPHRRCVFELFGRRLPAGRRFGVVAGTGRLLCAHPRLPLRRRRAALPARRAGGGCRDPRLPRGYRFTGSITGYREGELYFPGSPILTVEGTFAEAVVLETLALSVLNHDSAVATAAARMSIAAGDRPLAEMGSRRAAERVRRRRGPRRLHRRVRRDLEPRGGPALGHPDDGHRGARVDAAARHARRTRSARRSTALGVGHDAARRHLRHPQGVETAIRVAGTGPRRRAHRLRRPSDRGRRGARAARRARRDRHEDHRDQRPRRVRDRRAGGIPRRLVRRRDLGRHRLGHTDGRHGLQARRAPGCRRRLGRRREGVDRQGVEGRAQGGVPHARAGHGDERAHRRLGRVRAARHARRASRCARTAGALVVDGEADAAFEGWAGVEAARAHHALAREELPVRALALSRSDPAIPTVYVDAE